MGINLGALIGGATQGVGQGMQLVEQYNQIAQQKRQQAAAEKIGAGFRDAAQRGGLGAMDDNWFTEMAANVADTGDYEGAVKLSDLGNTFRVRRGQQAAQRGQVNLAAGNYEAALGDLNESMAAMGGPAMFSGLSVGADGMPMFTTATGGAIPASKAQDVLLRLTSSPEDVLKLMITQATANAEIYRNNAAGGLSEAKTNTENTMLPYKVNESVANTTQSYAAANASNQQAQRTALGIQTDALLQPSTVAEQEAKARKETVAANLAETTAPAQAIKTQADAEDAAAKAVVTKATVPSAIQTSQSGAIKAAADADLARTNANVADMTVGATVAGKRAEAQKLVNEARANPKFADIQKQIADELKAQQEGLANGFEPDSLGLTADTADLVTRFANEQVTQNPSLEGPQAVEIGKQMVMQTIAALQNLNPDLADPVLAARVAKVIQQKEGMEPDIDPATNQPYFDIDTGLGTQRIFVGGPISAIPTGP